MFFPLCAVKNAPPTTVAAKKSCQSDQNEAMHEVIER